MEGLRSSGVLQVHVLHAVVPQSEELFLLNGAVVALCEATAAEVAAATGAEVVSCSLDAAPLGSCVAPVLEAAAAGLVPGLL